MTPDDRLGHALATIADDLRPTPDPYARVLARHHRSVRRRLVAVAAAVFVVAVVVSVTLVSGVGTDTRPAHPTESDRQMATMNAWAGRLADGPTHGAVGQDKAFVADLAAGMMKNWRDGRYDAERLSVAKVTVPFVDDVGPYRIALVVLVLTRPDERQWRHASAWVYGPHGADAATLAAKAERVDHGLEPLAQVSYSNAEGAPMAWIAVVPPQCRFATTTTPADPVWTPEPTGAYIVRTAATTRHEWWRADCDGDVRAEFPAPSRQLDPAAPTEAELTRALAAARVDVDRSVARQVVRSAAQPGSYVSLAGVPDLIWVGDAMGLGGELNTGTGVVPADRAAVTIAQLDKGGWIGQLLSTFPEQTAAAWWSPGQAFALPGDPTRPDYVFVLRPREDATDYLVVPPKGAASVRATYRGATVGDAPVTGGAAKLSLPVPFDTVQALDATGAIIGTGSPANLRIDTGVVNRWSD